MSRCGLLLTLFFLSLLFSLLVFFYHSCSVLPLCLSLLPPTHTDFTFRQFPVDNIVQRGPVVAALPTTKYSAERIRHTWYRLDRPCPITGMLNHTFLFSPTLPHQNTIRASGGRCCRLGAAVGGGGGCWVFVSWENNNLATAATTRLLCARDWGWRICSFYGQVL